MTFVCWPIVIPMARLRALSLRRGVRWVTSMSAGCHAPRSGTRFHGSSARTRVTLPESAQRLWAPRKDGCAKSVTTMPSVTDSGFLARLAAAAHRPGFRAEMTALGLSPDPSVFRSASFRNSGIQFARRALGLIRAISGRWRPRLHATSSSVRSVGKAGISSTLAWSRSAKAFDGTVVGSNSADLPSRTSGTLRPVCCATRWIENSLDTSAGRRSGPQWIALR